MRSSTAALLVLLAALAHNTLAVESQMVVGSVSEPHAEVDEATREAALTAVGLLNEDAAKLSLALGKAQNGGEDGPVSLLGVSSVRTQVVAGINYFFTLKVADARGTAHEVKLTLWARPWLQNSNSGEKAYQLTHVEGV